MWTALQHLVWQKDCKLIHEAHTLRDEMVRSSEAARAACEVESFGSVSQPLGGHALGLVEDFPEAWAPHVKPELDVQIFPHLMCLGAKASLATFTSQLSRVCPQDDARFTLLVGPIKKPARIAVKVKEYKGESDPSEWPFICKVSTRLI